MKIKDMLAISWRVVVVIMLGGGVFSSPSLVSAVEAMPALPPQVMKMIQAQPPASSTLPQGRVPIGSTTDVGSKAAQADSLETRDESNSALAPGQKAEPAKEQDTGSAAATKASLIEGQYRKFYGSLFGADLAQFGYQIFSDAKIKIDHLTMPADDYRIGPGDKLRIRVWGSGVDSEFVGVVERNGTINVPQIGIVDVADVSYGQVGQVIRKESEKYIQGANVNVSLVDLRSVEVYVVGSVVSPSLHMVPAFSTIFDGLVAAGGVSKSGSLRTIELYRQGKLYKRFDLYDLLLHGKRDSDLVLENRDVIFIPRLGETVAVSGAVNEAAIFELNGEKSVADCLSLAGGLLAQGYAGRLHLRRYQDNREFVVHDIDTDTDPGALSKMPIQNGDLIEWVFLSEKMPQVVKVEGHVWSPDIFQYKPGMTIAEVLPSVNILKPGAVTDFAILYRYDQNTTRFTTQRIPLAEVLQGRFTMALKPYDRIQILSREELGMTEEVTISGAVWKPGLKPYSPGLTLAEAMALAGGDRHGALLSSIEVSRQIITNGEAVTKIFNLDYGKDSGFRLEPKDFILIKEVKDANTILTVHIQGQVRYPGDYKLNEGEHLSDLIKRAGGFLPSAYFYGAKFTSQRALTIQQKSLDDLMVQLENKSKQAMAAEVKAAATTENATSEIAAQEAIQKSLATLKTIKAEGRVAIQLADLSTFSGSEYDFVLEGDDTLVVPKQLNFVSIVGSVYSPSSFHYEPNQTVDYYLKKSGGPTKEADEDYLYILKANGEIVSKAQQNTMFSFSRFSSLTLMPGDTIVVPINFEQVPYLRLVKDISDIVFKIATTAGVAVAVL